MINVLALLEASHMNLQAALKHTSSLSKGSNVFTYAITSFMPTAVFALLDMMLERHLCVKVMV